MIRLAVVSGKGGTGKTVITASLAHLVPGIRVVADCDVDAPNLELLLDPEPVGTEPFMGTKAAIIDPDLCRACGACIEHCRFDAIEAGKEGIRMNPLRCEGCAVCTLVCPAAAISMQPRQTAEIVDSKTGLGRLVHARMVPGAGNSGLLVHAVKKTAIMQKPDADRFLIDGPPGTGCPLTSTISGVNAVLIVTEPSVSGLSDLKRVVAVCRRFKPQILVAVNRFDLAQALTESIQDWCREERIPVIGRIPFDPSVIESIRNSMPIIRVQGSPAAEAIQMLAFNLEEAVMHPDVHLK